MNKCQHFSGLVRAELIQEREKSKQQENLEIQRETQKTRHLEQMLLFKNLTKDCL